MWIVPSSSYVHPASGPPNQQTKNLLVSYSTKAQGLVRGLKGRSTRSVPRFDKAMVPPRVIATVRVEELIRRLIDAFGPLIFHQSGGCCEGTAPMCFRQSDFRVGANDVFLGTIDGCPFYIGASTSQYFAGSQLVIDVTTGGGDSFSLEAPVPGPTAALHRR